MISLKTVLALKSKIQKEKYKQTVLKIDNNACIDRPSIMPKV